MSRHVIGILGGGQLGRMLALAGYPLGLRFRFLDPNPESPAGDVGELIVAPYDDAAALERFARGLKAATFEFENVPAFSAQFLASRVPTFPPEKALATCQDRLLEKQLFTRLGIPTPAFLPADGVSELQAAIEKIELPCVVKTRRMGYDGKGQVVVRTSEDVEAAKKLASVPLIVEAFVPFEYEVSAIGVRARPDLGGESWSGQAHAMYPLTRNRHAGGILRESIVPACGERELDRLSEMAEGHVISVMNELGYVGVMAIEFFVVRGANGPELVANEIAPRVHNSGHWTIEGACTSQFENHIRAVAGLPLGSTELVRPAAAMVNLIGHIPAVEKMLVEAGVAVHLYGKAARPGRKVGHFTLLAASMQEALARCQSVRQRLGVIDKGIEPVDTSFDH